MAEVYKAANGFDNKVVHRPRLFKDVAGRRDMFEMRSARLGREIYLGLVYRDKKLTIHFALQFLSLYDAAKATRIVRYRRKHRFSGIEFSV